MNISVKSTTIYTTNRYTNKRSLLSPSLRIPIVLLFRYKRRILGCVLFSVFLFALVEVQFSDGEDAGEHRLHGGVVQSGGGEPQGAVGDAAALREKVEQVGALLDRLRAGWRTAVSVNKENRDVRKRNLTERDNSPLGEVELVESNRTAERVLRVLHHLQDLLFSLVLLTLLRRNLWIWGRRSNKHTRSYLIYICERRN